MEHDPKELRDCCSRPNGPSERWNDEFVRERLIAYADLIERHAKLLKHAEAMHEELMKTDRYFPVGFSYRTDFQKE